MLALWHYSKYNTIAASFLKICSEIRREFCMHFNANKPCMSSFVARFFWEIAAPWHRLKTTLFSISDLVSWIVDGINLKNQIRKIDLIKSRSEYQEKLSGREKWIPLQDSLTCKLIRNHVCLRKGYILMGNLRTMIFQLISPTLRNWVFREVESSFVSYGDGARRGTRSPSGVAWPGTMCVGGGHELFSLHTWYLCGSHYYCLDVLTIGGTSPSALIMD